MNEKSVNMGGLLLDLKINGIDEALEKLNLLNKKIEEANSLIKELTSSKVEIKLISFDYPLKLQDEQ